jgi:hypothetical protein
VQEVVQRRVGSGPRGLVVDGAALRGGVLGEEERVVGALPAVLHEPPHHGVRADTGRRDPEDQRAVPLAAGKGHRVPDLLGDDVQLVDDHEARVVALQGAGLGRQRAQLGVRVRDVDPVPEHLDLLGQERVELHHPAHRLEDDAGLPLVAGDTEHLRALDLVGEQAVGGQQRGQQRLAVAAGRDSSPAVGGGRRTSRR